MSNTADEAPGVHPTVLLLPWYLSGQLTEAERQAVEGHIGSCDACKDQLESLATLRANVRGANERMPGPSARVRTEVFRRLDGRLAPRIGLLDRLAGSLRLLLQPKWAPAIAVLIIVGQLGALTWLMVRPGAGPQIQSRGLPTAPTRLRIVFNPAAPQRDVAAALRALGGHIVDGPAEEGGYTVELAPASAADIAARLRSLRERRDVVEQVDVAPP